MARLQLALNVSDLDRAVEFYSTLLGATPHKLRPGYANFAIEDPALKLVLIEGEGPGATLNHLGVEFATTDEVGESIERLGSQGLDPDVREQELCCHAVQDKAWVTDPDGARWEVYAITDDEPASGPVSLPVQACC